jgi:ATP-binding cassette, subfamily C, bacterial
MTAPVPAPDSPLAADRFDQGRNAWRYVRLLATTSWRRAGEVLLLDVALALTEGLGVLLLFPLLTLAGVGASARPANGLAGEVLALSTLLHLPQTLGAALAVYALVIAARALLQRASAITSLRLGEEFLLLLRGRLYAATVRARWDHLVRRRSADLVQALTGDLERQADSPGLLLGLVSSGLFLVMYVGVAARLSGATTALALATGAGLMLVLRRRRQAARDAASLVDDHIHVLFTAAEEHVHGIRTTKEYGAEERSSTLLHRYGVDVARANVRCERLFADARATLSIGSVLVLCLTVYTAHRVARLDAAGLLVLLYVFMRLTPQLSALQNGYQNFMRDMPVFARVLHRIEECEEAAEHGTRDDRPMSLRECIALRDVRCAYLPPLEGSGAVDKGAVPLHGRRRDALRSVSMRIPARETTAIVGPSGAGKSTAADLLLGLLFAQSGEVSIDGDELTPARAPRWREHVGYVPQVPFLFHDTIRANLQWAAPDATEGEMHEALALAGAADFVARLPRGLDTVIGDRGSAVSGGERQRLALARALLRRPALLILDEATSAVDAECERRIRQVIASLHGRMTVLIITHALAAVRDADHIYVLEDGHVTEAGCYDTLLALGGRFTALCTAQGLASSRLGAATDPPEGFLRLPDPRPGGIFPGPLTRMPA